MAHQSWIMVQCVTVALNMIEMQSVLYESTIKTRVSHRFGAQKKTSISKLRLNTVAARNLHLFTRKKYSRSHKALSTIKTAN